MTTCDDIYNLAKWQYLFLWIDITSWATRVTIGCFEWNAAISDWRHYLGWKYCANRIFFRRRLPSFTEAELAVPNVAWLLAEKFQPFSLGIDMFVFSLFNIWTVQSRWACVDCSEIFCRDFCLFRHSHHVCKFYLSQMSLSYAPTILFVCAFMDTQSFKAKFILSASIVRVQRLVQQLKKKLNFKIFQMKFDRTLKMQLVECCLGK